MNEAFSRIAYGEDRDAVAESMAIRITAEETEDA